MASYVALELASRIAGGARHKARKLVAGGAQNNGNGHRSMT
jgi:NO-binding membrane sensor protein with MHYT domain